MLTYLTRKYKKACSIFCPKFSDIRCAYLNASFVRRPHYGLRGEAEVADNSMIPEYIASQGPLSHTVADFLAMVYEQKASHIIMLCR